MKENLDKWLQVAVDTSYKAGRFLREAMSTQLKVEKHSAHDIKLEADRLSEEKILFELSKKSAFSILTEERGFIDTGSSSGKNICWIVDPLDGSLNYYRGIPSCCVSIALWSDDKPLLGVVYNFVQNDLFSCIVGKGAWLNGKIINVSLVDDFRKSVCFTGFPSETDFSSNAIKQFVKQVQVYKKIRLIGSAALSLAYVAAGKGEAYFEKDIKIWDVAAGIALVLSAGGRIIKNDSKTVHSVTLFASNNRIPSFEIE